MKRIVVLTSCLLLSPWVNRAQAEDLHPPPWRGQWSTTSQVWEFLSPNPGPVAPDGPAPGGMPPLPSTHLMVHPGPAMDWYLGDPPAEGVWPLSGWIDAVIDNHNPPNDFKWVWLQLTWQPQEIGAVPTVLATDPLADPRYPVTLVSTIPLSAGWVHSTYDWRIFPNPVDEWLRIEGNINVDELIVDTWCRAIPAPGAMLLVGIGAGALRWMRRRRIV